VGVWTGGGLRRSERRRRLLTGHTGLGSGGNVWDPGFSGAPLGFGDKQDSGSGGSSSSSSSSSSSCGGGGNSHSNSSCSRNDSSSSSYGDSQGSAGGTNVRHVGGGDGVGGSWSGAEGGGAAVPGTEEAELRVCVADLLTSFLHTASGSRSGTVHSSSSSSSSSSSNSSNRQHPSKKAG